MTGHNFTYFFNQQWRSAVNSVVINIQDVCILQKLLLFCATSFNSVVIVKQRVLNMKTH